MAEELQLNLPIHQPEKASTPDFEALLRTYNADLFIVVAYGEIIKQNILDIPRLGCINVHASILPKYRGAAPIQRVIMEGEKVTGVTIMDMVLKMDAGDIIQIVETPITENMTSGELSEKLCQLACPALLQVIDRFAKGTVQKTPQDPSQVTFAAKINVDDELIHWNWAAVRIHNLIRALSPKPGAWTPIQIGNESKRLKILRSQLISHLSGQPGEQLAFGKEGWIVACGNGAIQLLEVQLEGKKKMAAEDFIKGNRLPVQF
jgi:methionyl-tRNA formyltransferase